MNSMQIFNSILSYFLKKTNYLILAGSAFCQIWLGWLNATQNFKFAWNSMRFYIVANFVSLFLLSILPQFPWFGILVSLNVSLLPPTKLDTFKTKSVKKVAKSQKNWFASFKQCPLTIKWQNRKKEWFASFKQCPLKTLGKAAYQTAP